MNTLRMMIQDFRHYAKAEKEMSKFLRKEIKTHKVNVTEDQMYMLYLLAEMGIKNRNQLKERLNK